MKKLFFLMAASFLFAPVHAQITERERPAEWQHLVKGARFMDRFLPMPDGIQAKGIWGTDSVLNRYVDNGIELPGVSFWGGNILQDTEGKYHLFVCGWPENSPKGHMFWSNSTVFHAVSDRLTGPFKIRNSIGKGHNPEAFRLSDGRIVVYVIDGYYIADRVDDKVWTYGKFSFDPRDRKIIEGLSNLTFARRQDGSYLMVCRGGGVWISKDGLSPYKQLTDKRVYPDVEGRFEDPVVWRDDLQYHLIVNDWLGRIAFYQRSKDGVHWVTEQGEAYMPGVSFHKDGTVERWFKYERPKVFQDEKGRAVQMNFAVIDTIKWNDLRKYSINSLVYWVTYVHNVVYSFYRSMIYCYINSTQRCAGSIVIDIIPTNGADKRKFFPFAPYFPVTNVIKRYFYPYFPAIIGIKGYSFPYFPYLSGIMKIKTALYSLFSRLDWHKTVVFPCLGEIYEGIRSLSWEIPVT